MRIGAYQFSVTGSAEWNLNKIRNAMIYAAQLGVRLLVFPECALTGYPPRDIESASSVEFEKLSFAYEQIQATVDENNIYVLVGSIIEEKCHYFNSAVLFTPFKQRQFYHKRALWGWDKDSFSIGDKNGVFEIDKRRIGVRICFEERFPEFFRELYRERTDLNVILFYDVSDRNDEDRYELIKSHIRTRAVENVTYTLSVDTISPYQTAPTILYDRSGNALCEQKRNEEGLLIYDLNEHQLNFGEQGRKEISDWLTKG